MALLAKIPQTRAETLQLEFSMPLTKRYSQEHGQRLQQLPLQDAFARNPVTLSELCSNRAGKGRDGLQI